MSFGLRDEDWINPPDPEFEEECGELEFVFKKTPVYLHANVRMVEFTEFEFDDKYYDKDFTGSYIADGWEIDENLSERLYDALEELGFTSGECYLSGWASIPYSVWVPIPNRAFRRYRNYEDYDQPEADIEVHWKDVSLGQITAEAIHD